MAAQLACLLTNRPSVAASGSVSVNLPPVFLIVPVGTGIVLPRQVGADLRFSSAVRQIPALLTLKGFNEGHVCLAHSQRETNWEKAAGEQFVKKLTNQSTDYVFTRTDLIATVIIIVANL